MRLEMNKIAEALGKLIICPPSSSVSSFFAENVVNDSRKVTKGAIFAAISGTQNDGRLFINEAIEKGAVAIIAEPLPSPLQEATTPIWIVSDAYAAYARLAELFHGKPADSMRLLGVTGTNGKTTTAFLIRSIMEKWTDTKCGLISTVEYSTTKQKIDADRTTPDAMIIQELLSEMRDSECSDAVIEVSSHSLVQNRLASAKFAAAVFTNLSGEHLDYHKNMESYFEAKKMLFTEHWRENGTAIVNIDDVYGRKLAETVRKNKIRVSTFGISDAADTRILKMEVSLAGLELVLRLPNATELDLSSKLCGAFNARNIAGAAAATFAIGATPEAIKEGISDMRNVPGRMERCGENNIFVDYAHTDDALANVLSMARSLIDSENIEGELIVLFGCGGDRDKTKRPRMGSVAAKFADKIFVTTDNPRTESPSAIIAEIMKGVPTSVNIEVIEDRADAIASAVKATRQNDVLIIAGKGHETYQEINGKRFPFDDRRIAIKRLNSEFFTDQSITQEKNNGV